ncbi:hypothetical protein E4V99_10080 [Microbacterium sp. dk485]|uniref:DUF5692 family protein n=1 Tax=Microbacterium sp. dk485 TaxID=2560021 RepID=UPI00107416F6|nr:DUF5692 family protein [Microbacterium sp. dk485]TFV85330.1 hypothetical protein E4V99_10080 [Microbacterium sp. dk485]
MFLYESIPWYSWAMFGVVLVALIALNEVTRRWKWAGIGFFVVLPLVLTIFVWPTTAGEGSSTGTWFHWVKVYSALIGCLGFMLIRYIPRLAANRWMLLFPPLILAINIGEAVIRDFEVAGLQGMHDGVFMVGGPWNYMNAIAGILNLITICGWAGIIVSSDKSKDMIWPDMMWFWIIAYDLWNFAYVYNCVGDHSFYAGAALLISCTIPAFFIKKGAWLQHRAHTLALWMMFTMAVPTFVTSSPFAVQSSHNPTALFVVSALSLAANVAVAAYQLHTIVKLHKNPLRDELYTDLPQYKEVRDANLPVESPVALPQSRETDRLVTA